MLSFVPDVAEGAVEDEVNAPPSVLKRACFGQLSVQYLLQTQELLRESCRQNDAQREEAHTELREMKRRLKVQREQYNRMKREKRKQSSLMKSYAAILEA